jgi:hypothetical protein
MYLWRVEIDGRSYAAAPTQASKFVTPPAPACAKFRANIQWMRFIFFLKCSGFALSVRVWG